MTGFAVLPAAVGVYGGGRMGAGIAHAFLAAGTQVVIVEMDESAAEAARERVERNIVMADRRGGVNRRPEEVLASFRTATDASALAGCGLVVEAVPESVELKVSVLDEVERAVPEAVLATNTSSLSVNSLAAALARPDRFIGLHFFNPVPASELVEIVIGTATSTELTTAARAWIAALGKTAITVTDSPGFASSRLGLALALEAMRMLEDGVASAEDIDTAMTLGYKHQMGPLRTTDVVGLDVRLAIAEHLATEVGDRFQPPAILRDKVSAGQLGRKTGQGFYAW
ncbi:3-hydroxyacyl-CoA dehydrogenase family protein [Nocardia sp. NPDC052278]|uniref:3-hydroxyacyl-CoA dehydrogenase family protein n=1 Tax=unclassified Nocardia TaxID=2637762 RepID=UPI0036C95B0D